MAKYSVSFGSDKVTMTPVKGDPVSFAYVAKESMEEAIRQSKAEIAQRDDNARAYLSMLCDVFAHQRVAGFAKQTPIGERLPNDFKEAVREAEVLVIKPSFTDAILSKAQIVQKVDANGKQTPEWITVQIQADKLWGEYVRDLRDGMYARYKATASIYFAYFGLLPCVYNADGTPDTNRLLTVTAMEKLIANAKTDLEQESNEGVSLALVKLMEAMNSRNEKTVIGDIDLAITALQSLTNTFTAIKREKDDADKQQGHINAIQALTQEQINAKQASKAQVKATEKASKAQAKKEAKEKQSIDAQAKAIVQNAMEQLAPL